MKRNRRTRRVKVSADGEGLVSRAGVALLRELTEDTGLAAGWTNALLDTYKTFPAAHMPGRVLCDLAVVIADGGDALAHLATLRDQRKLFGAVASDATAWRCVERVDASHLTRLRSVRAAARERAWAAGAGPELRGGVTIDIDDHHRPFRQDQRSEDVEEDVRLPPAAGLPGSSARVRTIQGLAGILRPGNAGSNTTADHVEILGLALAALPDYARPRPGDPDSPQVLIRTDAAGATYGFAAACRGAGCGFSLGYALDERAQQAIAELPEAAWSPAHDIDGEPREGAWVAELTGLLDLAKWPTGSRVIVRRERPHPGAQLRFTDADGHRFTAFITDTKPGGPKRQHTDLEVRHRAHARVEDRIRCGKATGLRNLPSRFAANAAWLALTVMAHNLGRAVGILAGADLTRATAMTLRRTVFTVPGRLVRSARRQRLRLPESWPWADQFTTALAAITAIPMRC